MKTEQITKIAHEILHEYNEAKKGQKTVLRHSAKENLFLAIVERKHYQLQKDDDTFVIDEKTFLREISAECQWIQPKKAKPKTVTFEIDEADLDWPMGRIHKKENKELVHHY